MKVAAILFCLFTKEILQGHCILKAIIALSEGKAIESTPAQYHDIFISSIKALN